MVSLWKYHKYTKKYTHNVCPFSIGIDNGLSSNLNQTSIKTYWYSFMGVSPNVKTHHILWISMDQCTNTYIINKGLALTLYYNVQWKIDKNLFKTSLVCLMVHVIDILKSVYIPKVSNFIFIWSNFCFWDFWMITLIVYSTW